MSDINYYSSDSDLILNGSDRSSDSTAATSRWRPGRAGLTERVAMGDGRGDGFLVYFYERHLVFEMWAGGNWLATRSVDCTPLLRVGGKNHINLLAFGFDRHESTVSLGCVCRDAANPNDAASVFETFYIPNLAFSLGLGPIVSLGAARVNANGVTTVRTLDAKVSTVAGRVCSMNPLTKGELARLSGRERRYA